MNNCYVYHKKIECVVIDLSIIKYNAFVKTVELQSLTKAANALGYTQPGISHMISSLEKEIGFPLLLRTKDGVFPTENAKHLQYYMQKIVSTEETLVETANKIKGIEIGNLRIGAFYSTSVQWLPTIIADFSTHHSNVNVQIYEGTLGEMNKWLLEGKIDMAFMSAPPPDNYDFIPLWDDPILAVISKKHDLANQSEIDLNNLIKYPFITPDRGADETIWQVMNKEKLKPFIKYRIKGDMATISMIGQGLGVSLIPELAVLDPYKAVLAKPLKQDYSRTLGICINSEKHASPAAKKFISISKEFIEKTWNF